MITLKQIKAARALLDWRQKDLAKRSGISLAAINKLERGLASPRQYTLDILQQSFEQAGIEFTEGPGVRLTSNLFRLEIWDGKTAITKLFDDIINTMKDAPEPRITRLSGLDESLWDDHRTAVDRHQARLAAHDIIQRLLICDGDKNLLPHLPVAKHYRWIPKSLFAQLPYYIYADKYAMVIWGPPVRVIVMHSKIIADTFRRQFDINWQNGKIPKR